MNSRRRIAFTKAGLRRIGRDYSRDLPPAEWGSGISLHGSNPEPPMSALGQKRTWQQVRLMSALPPKADIDRARRDVCFVPKADVSRCSKTNALTPSKMPIAGRKFLAGFLDAARPRVWVSCRVNPTDEVTALVRRKLFPLRLRF
jgi:hypothetical protein